MPGTGNGVEFMNLSHFESFFQRVAEVTAITSQSELAVVLGVNRSAITQAKKKNAIPAKWILQLSRRFGLNPDWLEKGVGEKYPSRWMVLLAELLRKRWA